jgi:hypothetical protein
LAQEGRPFSDYDIGYWLYSRYLPRLLGHEAEPPVNIDQRTPAYVMVGLPRGVRVPAFVDLIPELSQDPWPNNVRQFQHDIERAVVDRELTQLGDRPILAGVLREGELIITFPHTPIRNSKPLISGLRAASVQPKERQPGSSGSAHHGYPGNQNACSVSASARDLEGQRTSVASFSRRTSSS